MERENERIEKIVTLGGHSSELAQSNQLEDQREAKEDVRSLRCRNERNAYQREESRDRECCGE